MHQEQIQEALQVPSCLERPKRRRKKVVAIVVSDHLKE
jgi:hypothetical protein